MKHCRIPIYIVSKAAVSVPWRMTESWFQELLPWPKKTATEIMHKIRTLFLSWDIKKSTVIALQGCSDVRSHGQLRHRTNLVILRDKNSVLILCIIQVAVFLARVVNDTDTQQPGVYRLLIVQYVMHSPYAHALVHIHSSFFSCLSLCDTTLSCATMCS